MTVKMTFAEARAKRNAEKVNSDLENLASALECLEAARHEIDELETKINAMAADIEAGKLVEVDKLQKLYNRATGKARL